MLWARRTLLLVIGVGLGIVTLVFATFNRQSVTVDLYFGSAVEIPLWAVVLVCLAMGWLVPRLLGIGAWFRLTRERGRLWRRVDELEREVIQLRNIPLDLDDRARPKSRSTAESQPTRAPDAADRAEMDSGEADEPAQSAVRES